MALTPIIVAVNRAGLPIARRVAKALNAPLHGRAERTTGCDVTFPDALTHIRDLFAAGHPVIGVCASGILIRAIAPLLANKHSEPPVLSVSDDGAVVVPLLGGHHGANRLAREIAQTLGATPAVTTAGDLSLGVALDSPPQGYKLTGVAQAKTVMADLLAETPYTLTGDVDWLAPVAALPHVTHVLRPGPQATLAPTDASHPGLIYTRQDLILGMGSARGAPVEEAWQLAQDTLAKAGLPAEAVAAVASVSLKADETALLAVAERLGVSYRLFDPETLEALTPQIPTPSEVVFQEIGCHGVAEPAALAAAGAGATLIAPKAKTANTTCAIAQSPTPITAPKGRARGRLSIVSIGPGQAAWRTPEASRLIAEADELVGYSLYIDLLGPLAAGKPRADFPLGGEEARCRHALERAGEGRNVALVCSGDAGIYAMGALVFELLSRDDDSAVTDAARRVEVICTPGVSALQAAAARAGAPLGHDFCAISLSDLLTPRDDILRRLHAAAEGDFVIAFYNPVSKRRRDLLPMAKDILLRHRPAETPVLLATSLGRPDEHLRYRTLSALNVDEIDMMTVVLVGSSNTQLIQTGEGPRMFTPRGYARKMTGGDLEASA